MQRIPQLRQKHQKSLNRQIVLLFIFFILVILLFLFYDLNTSIEIIFPLRLRRLAALIIVGINLSVSTVLFQSLTQNPILTPSILGYESLYLLIVTCWVVISSLFQLPTPPRVVAFLVQLTTMIIVSVTLFSWILKKFNHVYLLVLIGLIIGGFFRSIVSMLTSVMDPNEFMTVQDAQVASFSWIDVRSLAIASVCSIIVWLWIGREKRQLQIIALGRDVAINLGVNYQRYAYILLAMIAILVACSTALVGPLTFFGLLSAKLTAFYLKSTPLNYYLLASALVGVIILVGGQSVLEHVLNQATILPVVIEILGGSLLLVMIKRGEGK